MHINTQKEFKQTVSRLRGKLKSTYGANAPSHTQCMEMLAKVLGYSSLGELQARLPADTPAAPAAKAAAATPALPRYPLRNDKGQFDLVEAGEDAQVVDGLDFFAVEGRLEKIPNCLAYVSEASRKADGTLDFSGTGDTRVNWDGQTPERFWDGTNAWTNHNGTDLSEHALLLAPEDFNPHDEEADLPIRDVLIAEYVAYATENGIVPTFLAELQAKRLSGDLGSQIVSTLGFCLHQAELPVLEQALKAVM